MSNEQADWGSTSMPATVRVSLAGGKGIVWAHSAEVLPGGALSLVGASVDFLSGRPDFVFPPRSVVLAAHMWDAYTLEVTGKLIEQRIENGKPGRDEFVGDFASKEELFDRLVARLAKWDVQISRQEAGDLLDLTKIAQAPYELPGYYAGGSAKISLVFKLVRAEESTAGQAG